MYEEYNRARANTRSVGSKLFFYGGAWVWLRNTVALMFTPGLSTQGNPSKTRAEVCLEPGPAVFRAIDALKQSRPRMRNTTGRGGVSQFSNLCAKTTNEHTRSRQSVPLFVQNTHT